MIADILKGETMFAIEYELWGNRHDKGVWHIPVDCLVEALVLVKERCCRALNTNMITLLDRGYGDYIVYVNEVQKGRFKMSPM